LEASQNAMRDTTKWMVAAAAAVGAVLVAGLSLSTLPSGGWSLLVALSGFFLALLGVSGVIYAAAGVLVAGYSSFSELMEIRSGKYEKRKAGEAKARRRWEKLTSEFRTSWAGGSGRRVPLNRIMAIGAFAIRLIPILLGQLGQLLPRPEVKSEGIGIDKMLNYVNRDVFFLSGGLSSNLQELYARLTAADLDILALGGHIPSADWGDAVGRAAGWVTASARPVARGQSAPDRIAPPEWTRDTRNDTDVERLADAEWRLEKLETAAGQLIAFANQKIIEARFERLKRWVGLGGIAGAVGVAAFAASSALAPPADEPITAPTDVTVHILSAAEGRQGWEFGWLPWGGHDKFEDPDCKNGEIYPAVAVGGTWKEPLVVASGGTCDMPALTLTEEDATVVPVAEAKPD
jgi:hypothetical protein